MGPSDGKKSLPKRPGAAARTGCASFVADVLGVLGVSGRAGGSSKPHSQELETPSAGSAGPPEAALPQEGLQEGAPQEGTRRHDWRWKDHRWLCIACLTTSRTAVPPRLGKCAGMATNMARLVQNPRKHKLHLATFADGKGVVVVCSRCGHYATSNRPTELHKKACVAVGGQATFASPGAESAYRRISQGKHPKHAKGDAKVLDPCMPLEALARLASSGQEPQGSPS